jgi:hypothetical protein
MVNQIDPQEWLQLAVNAGEFSSLRIAIAAARIHYMDEAIWRESAPAKCFQALPAGERR